MQLLRIVMKNINAVISSSPMSIAIAGMAGDELKPSAGVV